METAIYEAKKCRLFACRAETCTLLKTFFGFRSLCHPRPRAPAPSTVALEGAGYDILQHTDFHIPSSMPLQPLSNPSPTPLHPPAISFRTTVGEGLEGGWRGAVQQAVAVQVRKEGFRDSSRGWYLAAECRGRGERQGGEAAGSEAVRTGDGDKKRRNFWHEREKTFGMGLQVGFFSYLCLLLLMDLIFNKY